MIFAIQNICAKNSQTKSKDKASIGKNNKPSVMSTLQDFTWLQLEKRHKLLLLFFFCQIQKYLKLIKVHSLVYKWFLHCYICIQKSFYMLKVTCTKPDKKVA